MGRLSTPQFHEARTCPNSMVGPTRPGVAPIIPAMPGPADVADPAAPLRAVTEAPAPGARPGPGMASNVRRVDAGPSADGAAHGAGEAVEGSTWPRRICPVHSQGRSIAPHGPARPPA